MYKFDFWLYEREKERYSLAFLRLGLGSLDSLYISDKKKAVRYRGRWMKVG
jgi:hypothetical protein